MKARRHHKEIENFVGSLCQLYLIGYVVILTVLSLLGLLVAQR